MSQNTIRHVRVADLESIENIGEEARGDVCGLEHRPVAVLDDKSSLIERGELGEGVGEAPLDEGVGEIGEDLAFDHGEELTVVLDAVVAGGKGPAVGGGLLVGKAERVALPRVDGEGEVLGPKSPAGGHPHSWP